MNLFVLFSGAQTVHQARFEHAHGGNSAVRRQDDRVLPDAKARLGRNGTPEETSTSGQDKHADQVCMQSALPWP